MNSNLKLLPAGLLLAVLALAGCGGGSSDDTTTQPPPPTPEEACEGAGNNWYEGACYTDQQLIDLGVEQGKKDAADEADAKANVALAKALKAAITTGLGLTEANIVNTNSRWTLIIRTPIWRQSPSRRPMAQWQISAIGRAPTTVESKAAAPANPTAIGVSITTKEWPNPSRSLM